MRQPLLIMMRHGQSTWNKQNLFTGWVDVPLSEEGIAEAIRGGKSIADLPIDVIFTSTLIRAQMTAMLAMLHHHSGKVPIIQHQEGDKREQWAKIYSPATLEGTIPVYEAWELNERMYGTLQGLNKDEMRKQYGVNQVQIWRRSFDVAPPDGESLKMTAARSTPYFENSILPYLKRGQNVFIAAHGNSMRSICMKLDNLSPEEVVKLEIPTGAPIIYRLEGERFAKVT